MRVGPVVANVLSIGEYAAVIKYVAQSHACEGRTADGAGSPLITTRAWHKFGAPVAATF